MTLTTKLESAGSNPLGANYLYACMLYLFIYKYLYTLFSPHNTSIELLSLGLDQLVSMSQNIYFLFQALVLSKPQYHNHPNLKSSLVLVLSLVSLSADQENLADHNEYIVG